MRLRHQLFLISLLTLLIPWAGYLFIQELEQTLRQNQLTNLSQHAKLITEQLAKKSIELPEPSAKGHRPVYAFKLPAPIILDGYFDDWRAASQDLTPLKSATSELSVAYQAGVRGKHFYLFIKVATPETTYRNPGKRALQNSDHLLLKLATPQGGVIDTIASPIAPGPVDLLARSGTRRFIKDTSLRGYWQDTREGYQVELEIPLSRVKDGIGFAIVKASVNTNQQTWSGITPPEERRRLPAVIHRMSALESLIEPYHRDFTRISLIDNQHWVIAQIGQTNEEIYSAPWQQGEYESLAREILLSLFKAVLGQQKPADSEQQTAPGQRDNQAIRIALKNQSTTDWFHDPVNNQAIIAAAYPINITSANQNNRAVQGVILVEQTTDAIASLSDSAMVKLIAISFSVVLLIVFVLLGFSSLLSWRVTRLRNQIDSSISEDGRIRHEFLPSTTKDELGDLSRSFAAMHQEVTHYTEYLENFSRKLSHELKTPLAIVRSSIENLTLNEQLFIKEHFDEVSTYLQRADEGTKRLSLIIQSMSEASRLEKSIESTEKEIFNLTDVVLSTGEAFKGLLTQHHIDIQVSPEERPILGAPELIAQLMDKLVDNAKDFTQPGGKIVISLCTKGRDYLLSVSNEGPLLPKKMQREIFSSFISLRDEQQKEGHMGQGLVIVKLITEYHDGTVNAYNLKDESGVCFEVRLPV
ncbi:ATP-binding protein [Alkalimarinus sediminis]|uniref:histidine kinase n=1 Tax=Alkalimarinus sediminis TaxID=1632866 RepID=A0A9E8HH32_9ALTE|nr:ATP-binding protein [Alkalimarinus sediminis]UZW74548.1 ATP-binding protein [Alkalimarinus sediminis]